MLYAQGDGCLYSLLGRASLKTILHHAIVMKECTTYKQQLRPAILEEAQRSFAQYGIKAVKMDDIARNLSISKRTVYELYATKEDLLCEVVEARQKEHERHMEMMVQQSDNTMDVLTGFLSMQLEDAANTNFNFFKDMVKYPKVAHLVSAYHERQRAASAVFFAKGVEEGFFLPTVDYKIFNFIGSGVIDMLCENDRYEGLTFSDLFYNYMYVIIRGICTPKGLERIDRFMKEKEVGKEK